MAKRGSSVNGAAAQAAPENEKSPLHDYADKYIPKALDALENTVGTVKKLTTDRAIKILTYIVYGLILLTLGIAALVVAIILLVRIVDVYGPGPLWAWYFGLGGIFGLIGMFFFRRRNPRR